MKAIIIVTILILTLISCETELINQSVPDLYPSIGSGFTSTTVGSTEVTILKINNNGAPTTQTTTIYLQKTTPVCNLIIPAQPGGLTVTDEPTRYKIVLDGPIVDYREIIVILQPTLPGSASLTVSIVSGTGGGESPSNNNITSFHFTVN